MGRNPIFWILLTAPLVLLLLSLQPTFDDWTYYTVAQTDLFTLQSSTSMAIIGVLLMYSSVIFSDLITDFFPFKPSFLSYWGISSTHG